jgi:hypothetical protein
MRYVRYDSRRVEILCVPTSGGVAASWIVPSIADSTLDTDFARVCKTTSRTVGLSPNKASAVPLSYTGAAPSLSAPCPNRESKLMI